VAVLTDRFWAEQYARSPQAVGQTVMIDGRAHEIVGVLTPAFEFGNFANLAMAVSYALVPTLERDLRPFMITARLAAGVTVEQAEAEFQTIATQLEREHPDTNRGRQALVLPSRRAFGGPNVFLALTLIVGTAALVTLIASINVAGVLLSRAVVRQREFALRVALGARRGRVFRQLTVEGLLLACGGAVGGLAVAEFGLRVIRSVDAEPIFQQIVLDWHELAFVLGLALLAPLLFSLAPALAALRVNLVAVLNAGGVRTTGMGRRLRESLVVSQLALAVALAIVGGLIARTAVSQMSAAYGFEREGVLKFSFALDAIDPAAARRQLNAMQDELLRRHAIAVGAIDVVPAASVESPTSLRVDGLEGAMEPWAHVVRIDEALLATLQVAIVNGRSFTANEIERGDKVALVSVETVRRYFNGSDAVGRHVRVREGSEEVPYQIIGVTGDVRNSNPEEGMPPRVWLPLVEPRTVTVLTRFNGDVRHATATIRDVARTTMADVPVEALEPLSTTIARMQGGDRVAMSMPVLFALVSVVFAAIGLYGTVSLTTNLRRAEFATRFALGASAADVTRLVLRHAVVLVLYGLVPGLVLGVLAGNAMRRMLFGVTPLDLGNLAGTIALLTVVTLAASAGPALRASRVDLTALLRL
jgi:putative ABC transport system permease protein